MQTDAVIGNFGHETVDSASNGSHYTRMSAHSSPAVKTRSMAANFRRRRPNAEKQPMFFARGFGKSVAYISVAG